MPINGTLLRLKVKRTGDPDYIDVQFTQNTSVSVTTSLEGTTNKDDEGWTSHIQGVRSISGSATLLMDDTATFNRDELVELIDSRASFMIQWGQVTVGAKYWEFNASLSQLDETGDVEVPATLDISFESNGKPEYKTVTS